MGEDTPEQPDFQEFVNKFLGGEQAAEELFSSINNPMLEAFVAFHEVYKGLLSGGFTKVEAQNIMGSYLYHVVSGSEDS